MAAIDYIGPFVAGFAESFAAIEGPRQARLAVAKANREIRREDNSIALTQLVSQSPFFRDASTEDRSKAVDQMVIQFSPLTISKLADAQAQGYKIFKKDGPFKFSNKSFGIANLAPKNLTENALKVNTTVKVISELATARDRTERLNIWRSLSPADRLIASTYLNGSTGKSEAMKITVAERSRLIARPDEMMGVRQEDVGSYNVIEDSPLVQEIWSKSLFNSEKYKINPAEGFRLVIQSDIVTDLVLQTYARAIGDPSRAKVLKDDSDKVQGELISTVDNLDKDEQTTPRSAVDRPSSTSMIPAAAASYLSTYNKEWFEQNIPHAFSETKGYNRKTMLEYIRDNIIPNDPSFKYVVYTQEMKEYIMRFLSEQFDLASGKIAP